MGDYLGKLLPKRRRSPPCITTTNTTRCFTFSHSLHSPLRSITHNFACRRLPTHRRAAPPSPPCIPKHKKAAGIVKSVFLSIPSSDSVLDTKFSTFDISNFVFDDLMEC
ncbi:hypothetical protein H5410_047488 [Solanum commersonii]|uniref:Uncharacterized protein n=1 Tax=Solanum commersonii TaxID=4109 RepID=A0A9J5XIU2_SOLCO|nr:hypothetical protein H5410_047488 [Solanum commersonii]